MSTGVLNINNLISSDLLYKVGGTNLKGFGTVSDLIPKGAATGNISILLKKIADLSVDETELTANNLKLVYTIENNYRAGKISEVEYRNKITQANNNYTKSSQDIQNEVNKLTQQLEQQLLGPYFNLNLKHKALNTELKAAKTSMSRAQAQSFKNKASASAKAAVKSMAVALGIPLTNTLISLVVGNQKLRKLVKDTNIIIDNAKNKNTLVQAKIKRDAAYNLLNDIHSKVQNIKNFLDKILIAISILQIIISILSFNPAAKVIIQKYKDIIDSLQLIIGIITACLQRELNIVLDLESQLHQLSNILDINVQNSPDFQSILGSLGLLDNNSFDSYKGFNFAINEDNTPGQEVAGHKRHYAVALDSYNVAVLKSDMSFTTDYQVLIDQLKIVIDQQNLQA